MRLFEDFAYGFHTPEMGKRFLEDHELFDLGPMMATFADLNPAARGDIRCRPPFPNMVLCGRTLRVKHAFVITEKEQCVTVSCFANWDGKWEIVGIGTINVDDDWLPDITSERWVNTNDKLCLDRKADVLTHMSMSWLFVLWVLQLLNCKNIKAVSADPLDAMKPAVRAHWLKKNHEPIKKHHTISVSVPGEKRQAARDGGVMEAGGQHKALHTCRGHFATYTEGHGLFGKLTGTFWHPACVKGSAKAGVITKDYRLRANG